MISLLKDFPRNVVAIQASGQITKEDYQDILVPEVEKALKDYDKIRLFYRFDKEFLGFDKSALWEDTKVGFWHFAHWERIAVVTDVEWICATIHCFSFLFPIRVFPLSKELEARKWIEAESSVCS
jgi:hypothetical protein